MKRLLIAVTTILSMIGCQPFFDLNISTHQVDIISPCDSVVVDSGRVWFVWQEMMDIKFYKITVVSPYFDKCSALLADSIVGDSITKIQIDLTPGNYQWSISAHNSSYSTQERVLSFSVK